MKAKHIVCVVLVLIGTNLFSYTTARYLTTFHVVSNARKNVKGVLERQQTGKLRPDQTPESQFDMAVGQAGGMYYGWNDCLLYWGIGGLLFLSGLLVMRLDADRKHAG